MLETKRNETKRNETKRNGYVYSFIYDWLNTDGMFIFWMLILNFTAIRVTYKYFTVDITSFVMEALILARDTSILFMCVVPSSFLIYAFFRKIPAIHLSIKFILLFVSTCTFLADLFTIYFFQMPINPNMMDILFATNVRESTEFLQEYLPTVNFWLFLCVIAVVVLLARKIFTLLLKRKLLLLAMLVLAALTGIYGDRRSVDIGIGHTPLKRSVSVVRIGYMLYDAHKNNIKLNNMLNTAPDVKLTRNDSTIPYVVFVLGESTNRAHMSIYGYNLPTTPNFEALRQKGHLYVFQDVIAPHGYTQGSMNKLFTFYRYGSPGQYFEYTSLFNILKEVGYYTAWMSNQEFGLTNASVFYSKQCDTMKFTDKINENGSAVLFFDEKLTEFLDEELNTEHAKNFYVLHLAGAHMRYFKRYPPEFSRFSFHEETGDFSVVKKQTRAEYDNVILYDDFVVNEFIRRLEDKNAIMFFVSDHGEEVYDSANILGHGDTPVLRNVAEIPMLIWVSEKFSAAYPDIESSIASSVNRPYMTDDMIHTILDIMSIETEDYDPAKSIINPAFDSSRPRIFSGHLYDKATGFHEVR